MEISLFLTINKISIVLVGVSLLLFTGCSQKKYGETYSPPSTKSASKEEIRNSPAMHRATMRPYEVFGKMYYPTLAKVGDEHSGIASWYGPNFHEKKTSNGEVYNMYAQTAAHKTLPMNTMVRVDNLDNGKTTVVRINDRGPFVDGRIIDLSNKAAHDINLVKTGTAKVKVTILGFHAKVATTQAEKDEVATVGKYFVQVGAFRKMDGAKITQRKFKLILEGKYDVILKEGVFENEPINRVWISGFRSEDEAKDFRDNNGLSGAMIIGE